ncbi:hypothetical protein [Micromonospora avicenniae]|uniref:hypothetical protein n=1 Tax=Micromonospora avicenniae TaxID=1198245 RepID=UPI00343BE1EE
MGDDRYDKYALYETKRPPRLSWSNAAKAIAEGEPRGEFFALPWWQSGQVRWRWIWGAHHNESRIKKLLAAQPDGFDDDGDPWYVGILYPGLSDEYVSDVVGIVTRAGHVGCVWPNLSNGGLSELVRSMGPEFKHFAVPLGVKDGELLMAFPHSSGINFFDWDDGESPGAPAAWRLNRSKVLALYLLQYGPTQKWQRLVDRLDTVPDRGIRILSALPFSPGYAILKDTRHDHESRAVDRLCQLTGIQVQFGLQGPPDAVVSRSTSESGRRIIQDAERLGVPIYRPETFLGMAAEEMANRLGSGRP